MYGKVEQNVCVFDDIFYMKYVADVVNFWNNNKKGTCCTMFIFCVYVHFRLTLWDNFFYKDNSIIVIFLRL